MARVDLKEVTRKFGSIVAVDNLDLQVKDQEFLTLVGPSGCGKTTTLNIIAGLEEVTTGRVYFDDVDVTPAPPERRDIAMVFQTYALYPHMSVLHNITFGLLNRGVSKPEAEERARAVAGRLEIADKLQRRPRELSGGQRQRVALARAIVRDAAVYLLDEPLSNLDARLRVTMRSELKRLHYELQRTFIYVTHDQVEALTMSDRIAVMNQGRIEQLGTPEEVYNRPATLFVAQFMGAPPINLIEGQIDGPVFRFGSAEILLPGRVNALPSGSPSAVTVGLRPEDVTPANDGQAAAIRGRVALREPVGSDVYLTVEVEGRMLLARAPAGCGLQRGENVRLHIATPRLHLFDAETGRSLIELG